MPLDGLRAGLRERGWVEGDNLVIEARSGGFDNAKELTAELLQAKVDLIVAQGGMIFRARPFAGATPMVTTIAPIVRPSTAMMPTAAFTRAPLSGVMDWTMTAMAKWMRTFSQHPGVGDRQRSLVAFPH